jgi:glucosamine--fructose-6-phosphate aminotransferase (isomerizing)
MALSWLSGILCGADREAVRADLHQAAAAVSLYLNDWRSHVQSLMSEFYGIRNLFLVGRGASLAATGVGGLIIKESAHFHAEGMSSASFRHGPFEMLGAEVYVAVFLGDASTAALNQRLCADVDQAGGRAALIGRGQAKAPFCLPGAPERLYPILEMLPVEMMTFALAAIAGREAGKFERATKITTVE